MLAGGPALAALGCTAFCFLPSLVDRVTSAADHCELHEDRHAHFCWVHAAPSAGSTAGWLGLVAVALGASGLVAARLRPTWRAARSASELVKAAGPTGQGTVCLTSEVPVALTVGLWRPRVLVSTGLLRALGAPRSAAVVAHERAHVARRDNLRKVVASALAALHLPGTRADLLDDLSLACEQACDRVAAEAVGDPLLVAEAILATERLASRVGLEPVTSSADGGAVEERVEALLALDADGAGRGADLPRALGPLAVGAAIVVALLSHDVLETLVSHLGS